MRYFEGTAANNTNLFYQFDVDYWKKNLSVQDYSAISIQSPVINVMYINRSDTNVIIIIWSTVPIEQPQDFVNAGHIMIYGEDYEARVI